MKYYAFVRLTIFGKVTVEAGSPREALDIAGQLEVPSCGMWRSGDDSLQEYEFVPDSTEVGKKVGLFEAVSGLDVSPIGRRKR